jgi:hypothetical protein
MKVRDYTPEMVAHMNAEQCFRVDFKLRQARTATRKNLKKVAPGSKEYESLASNLEHIEAVVSTASKRHSMYFYASNYYRHYRLTSLEKNHEEFYNEGTHNNPYLPVMGWNQGAPDDWAEEV